MVRRATLPLPGRNGAPPVFRAAATSRDASSLQSGAFRASGVFVAAAPLAGPGAVLRSIPHRERQSWERQSWRGSHDESSDVPWCVTRGRPARAAGHSRTAAGAAAADSTRGDPRLGGRRRAGAVSRSGCRRAGQPLQAVRHREHHDSTPAHGNAVGGGTRLERCRPLPGLERHPQQRADAVHRRRPSRHRLPQPLRSQQRQHLRPAGAAAVVRAQRAARGPLRVREPRRSSPTSFKESG